MKKLVTAVALALTAAAALPLTVMAHGGHGAGSRVNASGAPPYALCGEDGCAAVGRHAHDGVTYLPRAGTGYYGHYYGAGRLNGGCHR